MNLLVLIALSTFEYGLGASSPLGRGSWLKQAKKLYGSFQAHLEGCYLLAVCVILNGFVWSPLQWLWGCDPMCRGSPVKLGWK